MSRLELGSTVEKQAQIDAIYKDLVRRVKASPIRTCPVDMTYASLNVCLAQSCGKCVPCRTGLRQLSNLIEDVLENRGTMETLRLIEELSKEIADTADCAIGRTAAELVMKAVKNDRDDFVCHIETHNCKARAEGPIPCIALCPAKVDIPGYIALVNAGKYQDAVKLIRKDNPFPSACAYICEHPCEEHCRRNLIDDAINIRGLKRFAVDNAGEIETPKKYEATGKKVAVLGGGPAGLSAAYYLKIMGHDVTVFEMREKLGGMLRYGIPEYRLPKAILDKEIEYILSTGVEVKLKTKVGREVSLEEIRSAYDAVFFTIGAHSDKKLGIEGEDAIGVTSAVALLRDMGKDIMPDYTGKNVVVVGGGNVAMDVTRTSVRLGAKSVTCVYRRRIEDMTALPEEVAGAREEDATILALQAPLRIEKNEDGTVKALITKPQIIGGSDRSGRPSVRDAALPEREIPADVIIVAIGQDIESRPFSSEIPVNRGRIIAGRDCRIENLKGVFAGGDCVTGPATVIKAIAAGKTAAANIDSYLGFNHKISVDVEIPEPSFMDKPVCGRVSITELEAVDSKDNFNCIECGMTKEAADQESSRCLRCDKFGYGTFFGGREVSW